MAARHATERSDLLAAAEASEISLQTKSYADARKLGLQIHKEIDSPAGDVYLRTGIYDLKSSNSGTREVPLSVFTSSTVMLK